MKEFLEMDEESEAISSIEMMAEQSGLLEVDQYRWKWFIIALHNSLQCFMILALYSMNPIPILRDDHSKKFVEDFYNRDKSKKNTNYKLDNFKNLYLKIKNKAKNNNLLINYYIASKTADWSIKTLNKYRNDFTHYLPSGTSRSIINMIYISSDGLEILKHLCYKTGRIKLTRQNSEKTKSALNTTIKNINRLIELYDCKAVKQDLIVD